MTIEKPRQFAVEVAHHTRNFSSFPGLSLKWGYQRRLRCVNDATSTPSTSNSSSGGNASADDDGIRTVKEKIEIIRDFRAEVDKLKSSVFSRENGSDIESNKPWNLRSKGSVLNDTNNNLNTSKGDNVAKRNRSLSPMMMNCEVKSPARNGRGGRNGEGKRARFSVSLTKKEIEQDFLAMTGVRPARRPEKRPRLVQHQIDAMCPGSFLTEINAKMYKVNEQL